MKPISEQEELDAALASHLAVLMLYGGHSCSVCQVIKPQLEAMLAREYPGMEAYYMNCQAGAEALCAQQRVFTLPVVQLWFGGQKFNEFVRAFSLAQVRQAIDRPYAALFGTGGN